MYGKRLKSWSLIFVITLLVLLSVIVRPLKAHEGHAALPSTGAHVEGNQLLVSEAAAKGLGLELAKVTLKDLSRWLGVRAHLELPWDGSAQVTTLVAGQVAQVEVRSGDRVSAGQPLATMSSLQLESLQLNLLQVHEAVELTNRRVQQQRRLADMGVVAGKALIEAENELRQKRAQLSISKQKLLTLGLHSSQVDEILRSGEPVSSVPVISPIDGIVAHVDARVGQFVDTEQHLFNIVDTTQLWAVGEVLETDAWQIQPGQHTQLVLMALPNTPLQASIERVRLTVNPQKRTLSVIVPVDNQSGLLRPGLFGRLGIEVQDIKEAIVCPTRALVDPPSGETFVLLREGKGKFQRRRVTTGLRTSEGVEIIEGLFPGDRVVVTGTRVLASMFHLDPAESDETSDGERSAIASDERLIPVASSVVQLPPHQKAFATPVIAGRLKKLYVNPGDRVEKDQLLAELDSQTLRSLQLDLLEATVGLRAIEGTIERVRSLVESGNYPESQMLSHQLEQKTLAYKQQNIRRQLRMVGLSQQQIDSLQAESLSDDSGSETAADKSPRSIDFATVPVHSPFAGVVSEFDVVPGQIVHENDPLLEIRDTSRVGIEGYVFEQFAGEVEVGQRARVRLPAYPDLELEGRVVRVSPMLHERARVLSVWIDLDNPDEKLREGMLANVQIIASGSQQPLAAKNAPSVSQGQQ